MYRYIAFDVETPNRYNNRMSAIGISVIEDGSITESFFSYVNPETHFDYFNTQFRVFSNCLMVYRSALAFCACSIPSIIWSICR